jgi:hypothetical protein
MYPAIVTVSAPIDFSHVFFSKSTLQSPQKIHRWSLICFSHRQKRTDGTKLTEISGGIDSSRSQHSDRCRAKVSKLLQRI